ncbi:hypothetical protein H9Y04_39865 [Streptomyces sp. TRM66268-LWL]|uniref:DUF5667 domain-containing protein n=1 Tax=Streptomyces polyasparticus TaxID=2767826 RepID=A0ABR7ST80_9ACTN|nr:DUF5667 domain-containing protein [Streptomyces polyasparticus]MBC9718701.1 hypothetical protein [Streptomyces polyasparticus]
MIANVSAHRRANAFAQALEDQSDQGTAAAQQSHATDQSELTEQGRMLALADGLAELPKPEMDPEVKVVQRAQLVAAMEAMFAGGGADVPEQRSRKGAHRASPIGKFRPRSRLSKGIAAGGLTVGVAAGAFSGVAAASSDALPGDSLYGLKRGMEDFKLGLADNDSSRGELYLDQASTRLFEARRLMERGRAGALDHESVGEVRRALNGMKHDASEGHRLLSEAYARDGSLGPIQALSSFSQSHRDSWSALRNVLPPQLGDVGDEVTSVFDAIEDEVGPLQSLLPTPPQTGGGSDKPGRSTDNGRTGGSSERSTPSTAGTQGGQPSGDSKPKSPPSSGEESEGLLGGSTGGLLDPPTENTSPSPSGKGSQTPEPDITLPPLLPGLLPGLGIDGEDAE